MKLRLEALALSLMFLSGCTINVNSGNPDSLPIAIDDQKADVLSCNVYIDHYLEPLRSTLSEQSSQASYSEWIAHHQAALEELSDLPGEVSGVLTVFHQDQLDYFLWVQGRVEGGTPPSNAEDFERWSSTFEVPLDTKQFCRQFE
jgi:hypothetical protein